MLTSTNCHYCFYKKLCGNASRTDTKISYSVNNIIHSNPPASLAVQIEFAKIVKYVQRPGSQRQVHIQGIWLIANYVLHC